MDSRNLVFVTVSSTMNFWYEAFFFFFFLNFQEEGPTISKDINSRLEPVLL